MWKDVLSKFVEFTPVESKPGSPTTPGGGIPGLPGGSSAPVSVHATSTARMEPIAGLADNTMAPKFSEKIQLAYSKSPFFDIIQRFNEAVESLREFIPEEGNRFRAAVKQIKATPQQMTDAFQSLIDIVEAEDKHFGEVITGQRQTEITAREEKIKVINTQIETAMKERDNLATEVTTLRTKLDTAQNSFDGAAKSLESGIQDNLRKVGIYFPATATTK